MLHRAAWLVPLALVSYGLRFASSWLVLSSAADHRFDAHGFGLLGDAVLLLVLAPVMLPLLVWVLWRHSQWRGITARAATPAGTAHPWWR